MDSHIEGESKNQKINQADNHQPCRDGFQRLPRELALDIVSRLPVKSLIQFRFACRALGRLTHEKELIQKHLSRAVKSNLYLVFHCDYPLNNQLCFVELPEHGNMKRVGRISTPFSTFMPEFNVVGSCDGILCLVNSLFNDAMYIYNPFSRQYRELPKSVEFQNQEVVYGFGCHPVTKEYKVIKIIYYANPDITLRHRLRNRRIFRSEVQVLNLGLDRWRSVGPINYQLDRKSGVALVDGKLHWVDPHAVFRGLIVSFDISDELFREIRMPDRKETVTRGDIHLTVLSDCLSVATPVGCAGLDIWMMKEYGVQESWVKQFSIGEYSPKLLGPELRESSGIWRNLLSTRLVRVLCLQENGEILLEYKGGTLASYDPESGTFKDLTFPGMPHLFQAIVHVGSLNWIV